MRSRALVVLPIGTLARALDGHLLAIEISYKRENIQAAQVWMCRIRQAIAGDRHLNIVGPFSALDQHLEDAFVIDAEWIRKYRPLCAKVRRMLTFFT